MGFLLLWVWCCWSCFLLRALGARLPRMSISGVRMCERVCACARTRDTYAGIGHAGYRGHKYPLTTPKNRVLTPQKRGYIYIFIYFYLMVTNGHAGHQKHHPTHLLFPHNYFLYALSEQ